MKIIEPGTTEGLRIGLAYKIKGFAIELADNAYDLTHIICDMSEFRTLIKALKDAGAIIRVTTARPDRERALKRLGFSKATKYDGGRPIRETMEL